MKKDFIMHKFIYKATTVLALSTASVFATDQGFDQENNNFNQKSSTEYLQSPNSVVDLNLLIENQNKNRTFIRHFNLEQFNERQWIADPERKSAELEKREIEKITKELSESLNIKLCEYLDCMKKIEQIKSELYNLPKDKLNQLIKYKEKVEEEKTHYQKKHQTYMIKCKKEIEKIKTYPISERYQSQKEEERKEEERKEEERKEKERKEKQLSELTLFNNPGSSLGGMSEEKTNDLSTKSAALNTEETIDNEINENTNKSFNVEEIITPSNKESMLTCLFKSKSYDGYEKSPR
jgi:hypothetical protein